MRSESNKTTSNRMRITVLFSLIIALAVTSLQMMPLLFKILSALPPMEFDQILTEPADQIQYINNEDYVGRERYPAVLDFYPLLDSDYLFVHFNPLRITNQVRGIAHNSSALINYETGKRVLRVDWSYDTSHVFDHWKDYSFHQSSGGALIGNDPNILIMRNERRPPKYFKLFSYIPGMVFRNPDDEIWSISTDGKANKIYNERNVSLTFYFHTPLMLSNRRVQVKYGSIKDYQIMHNSAREIRSWNAMAMYPFLPFRLRNGNLLITQRPENDEYHFLLLRDKKPYTIRINFNHHIMPLMSNYDLETIQQFSDTEKKYDYNFVPLFSDNEETLLATLNYPGNPLFEINLNTITADNPQEAITFKGYIHSEKYYPVFAFDNQKKLLLNTGSIEKDILLMSNFTVESLAIMNIDELPQSPIQPIEPYYRYHLPDEILRISKIPLDADHMLGFGRTTFWKIRMDGGGIEALFPKAGEVLTYYNREARKMEVYQGGPLREYRSVE